MRGFHKYWSLVFVVLLLSCEDRAVAPIDPILSVFPLHKGVVWTFVESHLDVRGNPLDTLLDSLFIKADTSMYGENWSVIYLYGTDQLIRNDRGGVVVRLMSNDERAHTLFKYPARIGDSYGFPLPPPFLPPHTFFFLSRSSFFSQQLFFFGFLFLFVFFFGGGILYFYTPPGQNPHPLPFPNRFFAGKPR